MLALHPIPARPRITRNLITTKTGMATRPAAKQIVDGDIANAALNDKSSHVRLVIIRPRR